MIRAEGRDSISFIIITPEVHDRKITSVYFSVSGNIMYHDDRVCKYLMSYERKFLQSCH